ncbi:unnamed protein product [Durusdinium trenchii]|uniref:Uncharacterized protein n=1 Tax=Durusdinium trenchii TaxID=1381693 RepID=A0ABP0PGP3_9DINO
MPVHRWVLWLVLACGEAALVKRLHNGTNHSEKSVQQIVRDAELANLRILEAKWQKLNESLHYAETYLADSREELANLTAELVKSNLSQEIQAAKEKYSEVLVSEATEQENRAWQETLRAEEEMFEARERYAKALEALPDEARKRLEAASPKERSASWRCGPRSRGASKKRAASSGRRWFYMSHGVGTLH